MPRKARKEALLSALSLKNRDGKIIVVDKLELEEAKTKLMVKALAELKVTSALIVIPQPDEKIERSSRNIPAVKVLRVEGLNVYDLLRYEHLILTEGALKLLEERLARMRGPQEIIRAPLISEKGSLLAESTQQVLFKVQPDANKIEVKKAVETLFKVKVVKVRMARYLGKIRRVGKNMGRRPEWKKAYVTLREGDKIDFFGGA